jgi:hypothetical protein
MEWMIVFPPEKDNGETDKEDRQQIDRIALIEIDDPAAEQVRQPHISRPHCHQFNKIRKMPAPFPLVDQRGEVIRHPQDQTKNQGIAGNLCERTQEGTHERTIRRGKQKIVTLVEMTHEMIHRLTNEENCHTNSAKISRVYFLVKPDFRDLIRLAAMDAVTRLGLTGGPSCHRIIVP